MADADALTEASLPDQLPATMPVPPVAPASDGPNPSQPTPSAPGDEKVMPLVDHLSELRTRIFRSILAVAAGAAVGFYFADPILRILIAPLPNKQLQTLGVGDAFFVYLKISLVTGIILAMPVLLYQAWAFISPGLTPRERRAVRPWIPLALVFFALGVSIAYLVLPYAVAFLQSFTNDVLVGNLVADRYFDFVTTMFLAFGLVMEFPIVLFGLARAGVVGSERLKGARRYVILGTVIFAAVITPGGDLVSPMVLGLTMYALYEATIFVIARTGR